MESALSEFEGDGAWIWAKIGHRPYTVVHVRYEDFFDYKTSPPPCLKPPQEVGLTFHCVAQNYDPLHQSPVKGPSTPGCFTFSSHSNTITAPPPSVGGQGGGRKKCVLSKPATADTCYNGHRTCRACPACCCAAFLAGVVKYGFMRQTQPLLYTYQGVLPKLPVPTLEATCTKYLASVKV